MIEYAMGKPSTTTAEKSRRIHRMLMDDIAAGRMSYSGYVDKTKTTLFLERMLLDCDFKRELSFRQLGHMFPNQPPETIRKLVEKYKSAGLVRTYLSGNGDLMLQSTGK